MRLHTNGKIDVDPTYSKGVFYKSIPPPTYKFDIAPQTEDVVKADCRSLPLGNESVDSVMFDPPFLATTGKSLCREDDNNKMAKRFGVYPSESALHKMYVDSMQEFYRILKPNGILIFKCQDKVSSGKQYFSHCFVYDSAIQIGFYAKDLFILLAKRRMTPEWQLRNQKNARKFHSYFWVFQKTEKVVSYI